MQSAIESSVVESVMERDHIGSKEEAAAVQVEIDSLYDALSLSDRDQERLLYLEAILESWKQEVIESKFRKSIEKAYASRAML